MRKKLTLMFVALFAIAAFAATQALDAGEEQSVTYALQEGDAFVSGQTVDVKNGDEVVATITYGEAGGPDFSAAKEDLMVDGYTASTAGNGTNGNKDGGTFYTITPAYDGTVSVAVVLNAGKAFYVKEDGTALADYNGITVSEKYYGSYDFSVTAGKAYKVYCNGSKLGFYGFKYTYTVDYAKTDEPVEVAIENPGEDLTAAIAEAAGNAEPASVELTLQKGVNYKVTAPITTSGNIVINGNGATIDASGITGALFQTQPTVIAAAAPNRAPANPKSTYQYIDNITIKDVTITGIKGSIYYDNYVDGSLRVCVENFTIDNAVLGLETESVDYESLISFEGGGIKDFCIKNSTVYNTSPTGAKYFIRYNGNNGRIDNMGYDKSKDFQTWTYLNNTFYKAIASTGQWGNGANGQKYFKYDVENNIWVDSSKEIIRRLTFGRYATDYVTFLNNTYMQDGAFLDESAFDKSGTALTTDPEFKDAANADFTLGVSSKQMKHKTGDPRWIKGNYVPAAGDVVDITLDFQGGDLTAALNEKVDEIESQDLTVGDITINLSFMSTSTVSEPITVNKGLTIKGDNAVIDASALSQPMIQMNKEPQVEAVASGQYVIKDITIENVKVTGLTKAFFADNGKFYAYETFTVNNCVIEYATQSNVVFNLASSMAINFNITNSTIYSKEAGTANFIAMSGKRPWQITGYEEETGKLTVANNTFYNVAKNKQFMNTNTLKGQKYLYEFNSNIFANVSNKKIYGNMTNKKEQLTTDGKNTYIFDGTFFAETNYNGDEGLQTDPQFTNAEKGDFTIFVGSKQAKYETGDPRWLTYFDPEQAPVEDVELNVADGGNITTALAMAMADVDQLGDITINVSGDVTISSSIVAPNSLTITGATGATIDASGLEAAMITTPAGDLAEWMEGNLTIEGVNIKGLKKSLFASAGKNYLYKDFKIENSVIEFDETSGLEFDFRKGGVAKNFTIENSTLYALAPTSNSLYTSQSAQRGTEAPGVTTQTFTIKNSTLVNFAKTKNFFTHRQANQTWLAYDIENSIFVDCGKSGQVVKGINQGQSGKNPTWTISGNLFNFDGTDTSAAEATGDADEPVADSVAGVVEFKNAAEGNFDGVITLADGAETPAAVPGDNTNFSVIIADATSIKNVKTVDAADLENAVIFNLNGQRVEKAQKGLYIINGRKVVVK